MTLRLAHLSDLHFGEAPARLIETLAEDLRRESPDAVLVSGDLTLRARPAEFAAVSAFLASLGCPVLAVPGNHDIPRSDLWRRFVAPLHAWQRFQPEGAEPVLRLGDTVVLGLDTVQRAHWHLDWSAGGLSERRLARLAARLQAEAGRRILVVCHHPLRHPDWATGRAAPFGAAAALALLREAEVVAVLCGHLHRAETEGEAPRQVIAPTALSPRIKGSPNGWNLLHLDHAGLRVERRGLTDAAPA